MERRGRRVVNIIFVIITNLFLENFALIFFYSRSMLKKLF